MIDVNKTIKMLTNSMRCTSSTVYRRNLVRVGFKTESATLLKYIREAWVSELDEPIQFHKVSSWIFELSLLISFSKVVINLKYNRCQFWDGHYAAEQSVSHKDNFFSLSFEYGSCNFVRDKKNQYFTT